MTSDRDIAWLRVVDELQIQMPEFTREQCERTADLIIDGLDDPMIVFQEGK